jgi:hypothetical protein
LCQLRTDDCFEFVNRSVELGGEIDFVEVREHQDTPETVGERMTSACC